VRINLPFAVSNPVLSTRPIHEFYLGGVIKAGESVVPCN